MTQVKPKDNPIQKKQRMYVRKAISTLLSHKEISKSSHRELKNACEEALKSLDEQFPINGGVGQNSSPSSPSSSSVSSFSVLPEPNPILVHVEKFFLPFELACRSKTPRIVCSALDSIEKLVAYGHISYEYFEVSLLSRLGCANKDLWGLCAPIFIIVVYCKTATSYFFGDKE
jgi:hypothetical protein